LGPANGSHTMIGSSDVAPVLMQRQIDALRGQLRTTRSAQFRRLYEQCDWYRTQEPPREHPLASITYFGPAAANLALAYRLTGQRGYLDEAWRWIERAIGFPHWGRANLPDRDLDAAWLLHGMSLAYSWLQDDLGAERAERLREKLELQGSRLFDYAVQTEGEWWSSSYWQNHNWICYAGLAAAGYVLGHREWTERAKDNFAIVFEQLPADGSDSEGVVYWRYGVPWLAVFLDLLESVEGLDWWHKAPFLSHTFDYRLHQCAPGFEQNIDHGDCHDRRSGHSIALYYKLASVYAIPQAQYLADLVADRFFWHEAYASGVRPGIMAEAFLELLWFDPDAKSVAPDDGTPTSAYFADLGLAVARTSWGDDAAMVSFKSAPGGGQHAWDEAEKARKSKGWEILNAGHHHPDAGSFVYIVAGQFIAIDEGYSSRKRAEHHNTILVDGKGWSHEDTYHIYRDMSYGQRPTMTDVFTADGMLHATANTAPMYAPELGVTHVERTLVFTPRGRLVVRDRLAARVPRRWTLLAHADWPAEPVPGADGSFSIRSGPARAWLNAMPGSTPTTTIRRVTSVQANPTSSTPGLEILKTMHTVAMTTAAVERAELFTVFEPGDHQSTRAAIAESIEGVAGRLIRLGDERVYLSDADRVLDVEGVSGQARSVIVCGADHARIAVVAATDLDVDGRHIWSSEQPFTGVITR
jgi:Domain of unknown function (DUF4962)/Heparinase II/III-like protein